MMELRLPARRLPARTAGRFLPRAQPRDEDTLYTIRVNDQPAGSFHLIFHKMKPFTSMVSEIQEPLRNQGIGTRAAAALIEELNRSARPQPEDLPVSRVLLQVSGDNEPALALYRKLGFAFTETCRITCINGRINGSRRRTDVSALAPASFSYTSRIIQYCFKSKCFSTTRIP